MDWRCPSQVLHSALNTTTDWHSCMSVVKCVIGGGHSMQGVCVALSPRRISSRFVFGAMAGLASQFSSNAVPLASSSQASMVRVSFGGGQGTGNEAGRNVLQSA